MVTTRYRILLLDDDVEMTLMLKIFLENNDYEVITATDATEALNIIEEVLPDLIICDIMMPNIDGFEFRSIIWQDPDLQLVPFIFITALTRAEYRQKAFEVFADDYIIKPFNLDELLVRIQSKLKKYSLYQDMIRYDSLTNIFSRRFIMTLLNKEIEQAKRHERSVSLSILDLDNFKSYNDTYGHPVGDFLLQHFTKAIQDNIRKYDLLGRFGGEEFIIIMPETTKKQAFGSLDRLKEKLSLETYTEDKIALTFSGGIATFPDDGLDGKSLLLSADKALYHAKEQGKNTIKVFE
ncbi:diguanylate cyclase [bacterium]|nr:diguanylate cyclase [bacterium]